MSLDFKIMVKECIDNQSKIERIRDYFLTNYTKIDISNQLNYFLTESKKANFIEGQALSHCIRFWIDAPQDIEKGNKENEKGIMLYKSIENYQKTKTYLTALNNKLIYSNAKGKFLDAFLIVKEGLSISKTYDRVNYMISFSSNYSFLLYELGLYEEAYQNILEILKLEDMMPDFTKITTRYTLLVSLSLLKNYKELKSQLIIYNKLKSVNQTNLAFSYRFDLLLAIQENDEKKADQNYIKILDEMKEHGDNFESSIFFKDLAEYCVFKNDLCKAKVYYLKCLQNIDKIPGYKRILLHDMLDFFKKNQELEIVNQVALKLVELDDEFNKIYIKMIQDNQCGISREDYKPLNNDAYLMQEKLSNFNSQLSKNLDYYSIKNYIISNLKGIIDCQYINIIDKSLSSKNNPFVMENDGKSYYFTEEELQYIDSYDQLPVSPQKLDYIEDKKVDRVVFYKLQMEDDFFGYIVIGFYNHKYEDNIKILSFSSLFIKGICIALKNSKMYNIALINANHDALTQLQNRYGFNDLVTMYQTQQKYNYCFITMDIDDFKKVNDSFGHQAGDEVLIQFSKELLRIFGEKYTARIGGEEFVAISEGNVELAINKINELYRCVRNGNLMFQENEIKYSFSAGMKEAEEGIEYLDVKNLADKALYEAKRNGKNRFVLYK